MILAVLILPYPAWRAVDDWAGTTTMPTWLVKTNPFWLAFAPYMIPRPADLADTFRYFVATLALSAGLTWLAVMRVRAVTVARTSEPQKPSRSRGFRSPRLRGPSLDRNPVLWREWHRRQPSRRGSLRLAAVLALAAIVFSLLAMGRQDPNFAAWVNGLQVSIGLLLFSTGAVTSLGEERARGSLDVLLTTPLTKWQVLWGKWWGASRRVPLLIVLPVAVMVPRAIPNGNLTAP